MAAIPQPERFLKSLGRFLKNILKHPGSWISASLIAVGVAFAAPAIAPGLVIAAFIGSIVALPLLFLQAKNLWNKDPEFHLYHPSAKRMLHDMMKRAYKFKKDHPVQFAVIVVALLLLVTALVLTIGFFTGGAAFAFMAPLFAAIAAPFATAATLGVSLGIPAAWAGFYFIIAALNFPNALKRFLGWLDSFKYEALLTTSMDRDSQSIIWSDKSAIRTAFETQAEERKHPPYPMLVFSGIFTTIANGFSSPVEEKIAKAVEKKHAAAAAATPTYLRLQKSFRDIV